MTNQELAELERLLEASNSKSLHPEDVASARFRLGKIARDGRLQSLIATAREAEALRAENARLRRDRADLLTFAKAIQIWRSDADSYDRECDHPQRNYCEDVELMEGCADVVVRRVAALEQGEVK